jgi:hypothetical protein
MMHFSECIPVVKQPMTIYLLLKFDLLIGNEEQNLMLTDNRLAQS